MKTEENHSRGEADNTGRKKKMPVGRMILLDVLAIAVGLVVFALFHHVLPTYYGLFTEKTGIPVSYLRATTGELVNRFLTKTYNLLRDAGGAGGNAGKRSRI